MADCPKLEKCPFFNDQLANMPTVAAFLKKQYCQDAYLSCARYMVAEALGSPRVPSNLFPSEIQRAREIIAKDAYYRKKP